MQEYDLLKGKLRGVPSARIGKPVGDFFGVDSGIIGLLRHGLRAGLAPDDCANVLDRFLFGLVCHGSLPWVLTVCGGDWASSAGGIG